MLMKSTTSPSIASNVLFTKGVLEIARLTTHDGILYVVVYNEDNVSRRIKRPLRR